MDKIKRWTLIISAVSVVSGILTWILPEGKLKGAYKTLCAVVIVYAFLYPIASNSRVDFSVSEFLIDNYEVSEKVDKYALSALIGSAENAIEELLSEEIKSMDIDCKVKASCMEENGEIKVSALTFIGTLSKQQISDVTSLAVSLGFDKDIIAFTGENDEQ